MGPIWSVLYKLTHDQKPQNAAVYTSPAARCSSAWLPCFLLHHSLQLAAHRRTPLVLQIPWPVFPSLPPFCWDFVAAHSENCKRVTISGAVPGREVSWWCLLARPQGSHTPPTGLGMVTKKQSPSERILKSNWRGCVLLSFEFKQNNILLIFGSRYREAADGIGLI